MQTTKLIVARHGNTFNKEDVILRVGARTNLPLTEEGREQSKRLGSKLLEMKLYPTRFFAAPLRRTIETSLEVASCFEFGSPPQILNFLTELDYGEYDGLPETEVLKMLGAQEIKEAGKTNKLSSEELERLGKEALKTWDAEARLPVGWRFLQNRVDKLKDDWRNFGKQIATKFPGETVLATTSNGIARFSLALLTRNASCLNNMKLSTGAFGLFELEHGSWILKDWNVR